MKVIIDEKSGFCFGVKKVIGMAEAELHTNKHLYCLGDIIHNENEVERLSKMGLEVISHDKFFTLSNCKVLLRAHGEPPEIFRHANKNNIILIDGTCPVVNKLQKNVKTSFSKLKGDGTLVIFGKSQHPEVIGINGQIGYKAVIVQTLADLELINYSKPVVLYSQTTMSREMYGELKMEIEKRIKSPHLLESYDTICGQVANRAPWLQEFSRSVDAIVFAGGKQSSNSKVLFAHCKEVNSHCFFVSTAKDVEKLSFENYNTIGVCGATSTPRWLLDEVANAIKTSGK
jgi:4-hydroxy-3-methylbut-2-en-1-yl diphosphate reductase